MIELLQNLLKIKSISPNDMGCFDVIEKELRELGFNCERINYLNVENLYATFGNSGKFQEGICSNLPSRFELPALVVQRAGT